VLVVVCFIVTGIKMDITAGGKVQKAGLLYHAAHQVVYKQLSVTDDKTCFNLSETFRAF